MKAIIIATCLIGCLTIANAQLLTAAAIVIGAKILIGKGFVYGAAKGALARNIVGRGKREAEAGDFNSVLIEQNKRDVDDCAKFLVCHLNSKPLNKLDVSDAEQLWCTSSVTGSQWLASSSCFRKDKE